jgi:hypothetical protein
MKFLMPFIFGIVLGMLLESVGVSISSWKFFAFIALQSAYGEMILFFYARRA